VRIGTGATLLGPDTRTLPADPGGASKRPTKLRSILDEGQSAAARMYVKCTAVRLAVHVPGGDRVRRVGVPKGSRKATPFPLNSLRDTLPDQSRGNG
jgi:hypothetical protein